MTLGVILGALIGLLPAFAFAGVNLRVTPDTSVKAGKTVSAVAHLSFDDGRPVTPEDLRVMHTQKFHLLLIDPAFQDYQHLHPVPMDSTGDYAFSFRPATSGAYRLWANVGLVAETHDRYASADMGRIARVSAPKKNKMIADVGGGARRTGAGRDVACQPGDACYGYGDERRKAV